MKQGNKEKSIWDITLKPTECHTSTKMQQQNKMTKMGNNLIKY